MSDTHRWMFVPISKEDEGFKDIPLLVPKHNMAKQFQIEVWLNPKPIMKEIRVELLMPEKNPEEERRKIRGYVS